jgi:hypothetical protein
LEEPIRVGIGFFFLQIHTIDDVNETFDADVLYMRYWKDSRLAEPGRGEAYAFCRLPIDGFWMPEPEIENLRDWKERRGGYVLIDAEGNVLIIQRLTLTLFNPMDLREFPFDRQVLQVRMQPLFASTREMILYPLKKYVQKAANLYVNGWKVEDPLVETGTDFAPLRGTSFSTMQIRVPVFREKDFFVRKLIVPIGLIVLMSWTIFWINPDQFAPQLGLGATSMLTIIAYQFALGNSLPRISYHTRADNFILWSLIFVFMALVEAGITAGLVSAGKRQIALRIDRVCRVTFPAVYAVLSVATLVV